MRLWLINEKGCDWHFTSHVESDPTQQAICGKMVHIWAKRTFQYARQIGGISICGYCLHELARRYNAQQPEILT